ncbi:MAG: Flavobacterium phage [Bacteroidota bacterium]|jgi:hypothetical protein
MSIYATQRVATNNQSTVDYLRQNIFTFGNRYNTGIFINNLGESLLADDGILVVRNSGTFETATAKFVALTTGQTMIIAGLTYTSTGATTAAQLAVAFANLAVGATIGAGTATGVYSGALTGYATGAVVGALLDTVVFTASTVGNKTDLSATGTGTTPTFTIVGGTAGVDEGFSPATSATLANVIGILKVTNDAETIANGGSVKANYCIRGDIDAGMLILPNGVTLDTIVGSKALKDILTALGFVMNDVVEGTKYDN